MEPEHLLIEIKEERERGRENDWQGDRLICSGMNDYMDGKKKKGQGVREEMASEVKSW